MYVHPQKFENSLSACIWLQARWTPVFASMGGVQLSVLEPLKGKDKQPFYSPYEFISYCASSQNLPKRHSNPDDLKEVLACLHCEVAMTHFFKIRMNSCTDMLILSNYIQIYIYCVSVLIKCGMDGVFFMLKFRTQIHFLQTFCVYLKNVNVFLLKFGISCIMLYRQT